MRCYAKLMDRATLEPIEELKRSISSRVEVTASNLAAELADMLRAAYIEGCRDGYAEAVRIRDVPRCTGHCIFDGDTLTNEDLCCPIHGIEAQEKAALDRVEWMRACRASWPFAPADVLTTRDEEKL